MLDAKAQATLDDALLRAVAAVEAGRLVLPLDDSAAYWYEAALEVDPANARANEGLERALVDAFARADVALDGGDGRTRSCRLRAARCRRPSRL